MTVHARRTRDAPSLCLSVHELFHKFCPLQTRDSVNLTGFADVPQSLPFPSPRQIFSVSAANPSSLYARKINCAGVVQQTLFWWRVCSLENLSHSHCFMYYHILWHNNPSKKNFCFSHDRSSPVAYVMWINLLLSFWVHWTICNLPSEFNYLQAFQSRVNNNWAVGVGINQAQLQASNRGEQTAQTEHAAAITLTCGEWCNWAFATHLENAFCSPVCCFRCFSAWVSFCLLVNLSQVFCDGVICRGFDSLMDPAMVELAGINAQIWSRSATSAAAALTHPLTLSPLE